MSYQSEIINAIRSVGIAAGTMGAVNRRNANEERQKLKEAEKAKNAAGSEAKKTPAPASSQIAPKVQEKMIADIRSNVDVGLERENKTTIRAEREKMIQYIKDDLNHRAMGRKERKTINQIMSELKNLN